MLVVVPDPKFRISCTQAGPNGQFTQFFSTEITPAIYEQEIAPARTFVFYEDVQPLMDKNLIKGGSLENAIVVRGDAVLSKEPLRFPDEFVRHKILDIVGDLALFGQRIRGHVIAVKPGHGANAELVRALAREFARSAPVLQPHAFPPGEGGLDINEVMELLPHRYPFLMVDRIARFEGETKLHRREIGHDQRAVFRRAISRASGDAGRLAIGGDGPGGQHPDDENHQEQRPAARLFRQRRRGKIPQAGLSRRHAFHFRRGDEIARETTGAVEVQLLGE